VPENSPQSLYFRLLELLPIAAVKELAGKKLSREDSIKHILQKHSTEEIQAAFIKLFDVCKQHVHILTLDGDTPATAAITIPEIAHIVPKHQASDTKVQYVFYKTTQKFVGPVREGVLALDFIWPTKIVTTDENIKIHVILLEHGTKSAHIEPTDKRIPTHTEEQLLNCICVKNKLTGSAIDLNKGVKHMWDQDIIDSSRVQIKDSKSTKTEAMDHGLLFKAEYPANYSEYMKKPLLKTVFHVVKDKENLYGKKFVVDPGFGRLGFISYSSVKYIDNVINYILKNN